MEQPSTWGHNSRFHPSGCLPKAPHGGFTTVQFTFTAPSVAGTYQWQCMTPCGSGMMATGGAMQADGWMRGNVIVS